MFEAAQFCQIVIWAVWLFFIIYWIIYLNSRCSIAGLVGIGGIKDEREYENNVSSNDELN